jgi:hypothetical protein
VRGCTGYALLGMIFASYSELRLEGLRLRDSASFDDWQFFQTEGLRQRLAGALERLVRGHTAQATYQEMLFA